MLLCRGGPPVFSSSPGRACEAVRMRTARLRIDDQPLTSVADPVSGASPVAVNEMARAALCAANTWGQTPGKEQ